MPVVFRSQPPIPCDVVSYPVSYDPDHKKDPPIKLFQFGPKEFIDYWLTAIDDMAILRFMQASKLPDRIENPCLKLFGEADVVRATNQYLMPWVETLAQRYLEKHTVKVYSRAEVPVPDEGLRYDYVWYATYNGVEKKVLLLEFKGPKALIKEKWPSQRCTYYQWPSYRENTYKATNPFARNAADEVNEFKR